MPHFIDSLDDPLLTDGNPSFTGGLNLLQDPELLQPTQYADAKNLQLDLSGRIGTRRGCVSLGQPDGANSVRGLVYYDDGTTERLVASGNGGLHAYAGSSWASVSGYTPSSSEQTCFAILVNTLFATDNSGNIHSWAGSGSAAAVDPATTGAPDKAKFLISHSGRLWAANTTKSSVATEDAVVVSDPLDATGAGSWNAVSNSLRVGLGDSDPITGIAGWHKTFVAVFTRNGSWVINTGASATVSDWYIQPISTRVGCVSHRSIAAVGNDLFFLSDDGVRTMNRVQNETQVGITNPLSEPIRPLIERINWAYAHTATGEYRDNYYLLSVPLDSATEPDHILAYHTLTGQWTGYWTGLAVNEFAVSKMGGIEKLMMARSDGYVYEWRNHVNDLDVVDADYQDDGTDIDTSLSTRAYTFGDSLSHKQGFNWELEFYQSKSSVRVDVVPDDGSPLISYQGLSRKPGVTLPATLPLTIPTTGTYRVARSLTKFGDWRRAQIRMTTTAGKVVFQRLKLTGFQNTFQSERN